MSRCSERFLALGMALALAAASAGFAASEDGVEPGGKQTQQASPSPRNLEAGTLVGHHSNVFYRPDNAVPPASATTSTLYLKWTARHKLLTGYMDASATTFSGEADVADHEVGLAGLMLTPGRTRLTAEYLIMPSKVSSEEGEETAFESRGARLRVRQGRSRGVWVEAGYGEEDWTFDAANGGRDAVAREREIMLRFPLGGPTGLRVAYTRDDKEAVDNQHSWWGDGASLTFEATPGDRVELRLRIRRRERAYEEAAPLTENFGREDDIRDVVLDFRTQVARHWGIRMRESYVKALSTRTDRNYDVFEASAGIFVNF